MKKTQKRKKRSTTNANFYTDSLKMAVISVAHMAMMNGEETPDVKLMHENITNDTKKTLKGSIANSVAILTAQTMTLDVLYNKMINYASRAETLKTMQISLDMALRIQNQSRKTLLAIGTLTHPQQATFIKQQNVAVNQQVNNGVTTDNDKDEISNLKSENELISEAKYATLDTGRTIEASPANQNPATMAVVDRSKDSRGQGKKQNECL